MYVITIWDNETDMQDIIGPFPHFSEAKRYVVENDLIAGAMIYGMVTPRTYLRETEKAK